MKPSSFIIICALLSAKVLTDGDKKNKFFDMSASFMGADLGIRIGMSISNPLIEKISSYVKGPRIIVLLLFELIFFTIFKALGPLPLVLWIKNFI